MATSVGRTGAGSSVSPMRYRSTLAAAARLLLRLDDVASHRINWEDKASNLQAIAAELSVGVDSLVFVDDNPVERRWVRLRLPSVTVVELPADPYGFADAIRACPVLERLSVTAEDERRPELYAAQRKRA